MWASGNQTRESRNNVGADDRPPRLKSGNTKDNH